jgi:hypothetical protein
MQDLQTEALYRPLSGTVRLSAIPYNYLGGFADLRMKKR